MPDRATDGELPCSAGAYCGIDAAELAQYRRPPTFASTGGAVPQPDPHAKPNFTFRDEWKSAARRSCA